MIKNFWNFKPKAVKMDLKITPEDENYIIDLCKFNN